MPAGIVAGVSGERGGQGVAPAVHRGTGCAGLIAEIVAVAHERIDGAHGVLLIVWKEDEGVVEVSGALLRYGAAMRPGLFKRDHRMPPAIPAAPPKATRATVPRSKVTRSAFEILGRRDRTSYPRRSILSRTRMPPRLKSSRSTA